MLRPEAHITTTANWSICARIVSRQYLDTMLSSNVGTYYTGGKEKWQLKVAILLAWAKKHGQVRIYFAQNGPLRLFPIS